MDLRKINYNIFLYSFLLFFTIIIGFIFNEDSLGGAKNDFYSHLERTLYFKEDLIYYLLNYDVLEHRHSPVFFIVSSKILEFSGTTEIFRFVHLIIPILIYFFFYKCLKLRFSKIDSKKIILVSSLIFISPTIRSYSIWPDSYLYGILFFTISIYYYLLHKQRSHKFLDVALNIFYLSLSSYFMPIFSIFSVYFFLNFTTFFFRKRLFYKIFIIILLNIILSFPAFYYIFYMDINFLRSTGEWGLSEKTFSLLNFSNKIFYSSSIIFFHLIPFIIIFNKKIKNNLSILRNRNFILISLLLIFTYFFSDYNNIFNNLGGGGVFYQIFHGVINFPVLQILLIVPIAFIFVFFFQDNLYNYILLLILLFSNFQLTIYHNYFEPIIYIIFFTLISNSILEKKFFSKKNLNIFILFNCFYLIIGLVKEYIRF